MRPSPIEGLGPQSQALSLASSGPTPSVPGPPPAWLLPGLSSSRLELHADPAVSNEQNFSIFHIPAPTAPADHLPSGVPAPAAPPLPGWDESEVSGYRTLSSSFFVPPRISGERRAEPHSCRLLSTSQFMALQLPDPEWVQASPEKRREPANKAAVGPWAGWQPGPPLSSLPSIERSPGPASRLQTWTLGPHSLLTSAPRASKTNSQGHPSPRAFPAPAAGADSPLTPAPGPTSTAGKNQAGGRGRAWTAGEIAAALPTSAAPGRGFKEGDVCDLGWATPPGGDK